MSKTGQISIPHILILNPKVDVDKLIYEFCVVNLNASIEDIKNPVFSEILKRISDKKRDLKLIICLSESTTENITVLNYLIKNHKEYRYWQLHVDEREYLNMTQTLIWLAEQDALTELDIQSALTLCASSGSLVIREILSKSHHLEKFHISSRDEYAALYRENYTIQSYFSSFFPFVEITDRNRRLRQIARKCSLTLMMIRKFRYSLFSPLDKNVVRIIARLLYEQRFEPNHLKTLSISTSWEMKFQEKKSLEEVETLL